MFADTVTVSLCSIDRACAPRLTVVPTKTPTLSAHVLSLGQVESEPTGPREVLEKLDWAMPLITALVSEIP